MKSLALLACLPLLAACALPPMVLSDSAGSDVPVVAPPEPSTEGGGPLTPLGLFQPPVDLVETVRLDRPSLVRRLVTTAPPRRVLPPPPPSPLQLMQEGLHSARIGPGHASYRQVGAMHVYQYVVGGVYDLYMSSSQATGILFPPGEVIKVGLFLPKEDFVVDTKSTGDGAQHYDALSVYPQVDKGTYEAFVLMSNGRAYLFHIIVGKQGMLTVSFDLALLEASR